MLSVGVLEHAIPEGVVSAWWGLHVLALPMCPRSEHARQPAAKLRRPHAADSLCKALAALPSDA